jgi:predicted RNase H-like nuclease (RuvC/YqgF family)
LANNAAAMRDLRHSLNETEGSASSLRARVEQLHQENSKLFARLELAAKETSLLASEARDLTTKLELTSQGVAQRDTEFAAASERIRLLSATCEQSDWERRSLHLAKPEPSMRRLKLKRRWIRLRGGVLASRVSSSDVVCLERSGLLEEAWYLKTHRDVMLGTVDPLLHYLAYGANEGRNPHPCSIRAGTLRNLKMFAYPVPTRLFIT